MQDAAQTADFLRREYKDALPDDAFDLVYHVLDELARRGYIATATSVGGGGGHHHGGGGRGWGGFGAPWGGMWYPPMWQEVEIVSDEDIAAEKRAKKEAK